MLRSRSPLPTAQVEVLSAALRASTLDAHDEAGGAEQRSELQDAAGAGGELPNCSISEDTSEPLVVAAEAAEEVINWWCLPREPCQRLHGDSGGQHSSQLAPVVSHFPALPFHKVKITILTSSILVTLVSY